MPVVKFIERLDLEKTISSLDRHELAEKIDESSIRKKINCQAGEQRSGKSGRKKGKNAKKPRMA